MTDVFFPAWEWGPRNMPWLRYICASYSQTLTERDNMRCRNIVVSDRYQRLWKNRFAISGEQFTKINFANNKTGWKLATSVGGVGLGARGNRIIIDDANDTMEVESETTRNTTNMWFTEVIPDRLNNQAESAIIVIQQRLNELDVSGIALAREMGYVHLCVPMYYEPSHLVNGWIADKTEIKTFLGDDIYNVKEEDIFWQDPRTEQDELAWPERFSLEICEELKRDKGPHAWAGQYQQTPEPRGGSIIKRDFWKLWKEDKFPECEYILASLDSAYTAKEENDASALTIWGSFRDEHGNPKVILMYAWQERLEFNALVQKVIDICTKDKRELNHFGEPFGHPRYAVDRLLIEAKASGLSVGQEMHRLYGQSGKFGIELINPTKFGDKVARVHSIQHIFAEGLIYAPDRNYAQMVIDQCVIGDTLIITASGVKPIRDIEVGERILTHKGRFRPVLAVSKRQADDLVVLSPKSLDAITLTKTHPVYTLSLSCERNPQQLNWVNAGEVRPRRYNNNNKRGKNEATPSACEAMVLPVVFPESQISEIDLRDWATLPQGKKYTFMFNETDMWTTHWKIKSIKWSQKLDFDFGRIVGLYLAEGSGRRTQTTWSFNAKTERYLIEEVKSFIKNRLGCLAFESKAGSATNVVACLPLIESFFSEMGRLAHNKHIPEWVWDAPDIFVKGLLEGYIDGDGCYIKTRDLVKATTVSISLAWGIRLLAARLGISATINLAKRGLGSTVIMGRHCKTRDSYTISWRENPMNKGASLRYGNYYAFSVMKKEDAGHQEVYNLEVAEDHSYCTTAGAVHNCAVFPKGARDDLVDSTAQAIRYLRDMGFALRREEHAVDTEEEMKYRPKQQSLYPV